MVILDQAPSWHANHAGVQVVSEVVTNMEILVDWIQEAVMLYVIVKQVTQVRSY